MKTLYQDSDSNKWKTIFLFSGFLVFFIAIGYALSVYFNDRLLLWLAIGFSTISSFASYWWSDKLVLSMVEAKLVTRESNREIYRVVENLCITAGLPVPKIYLITDEALNAFATGRNPQHSAIALTTGLVAKLDKTELEGVIAHELSHIGNYDILLATVATVLVGSIAILADLVRVNRLSNNKGGKGGGVVQLIIILIVFVLGPLSARLLSLAISRNREYLADTSGALLTRYPEGLARALEKISVNPSIVKANQATAHMFIYSPVIKAASEKDKNFSFFTKILATHPPVKERITRLRGMDMR